MIRTVMPMSCNIPSEILDYIQMVESDKVPACKEQKQLAALVRRIFETEDIYVDKEQLHKYMSYQKYFPFQLFEWEKFCFALHNCTYVSETGLPRFGYLLMLVGRGAGKNGYLSFEDFCLLTPTNGVKYYHIDVCATSEKQAKTSFEEIRTEVLENPQHKKRMKKFFRWTREVIENIQTGSRMQFHTNNAKSKDGLRSGKLDFDEYHQYENYDNISVFTGGLGKKPHPRRTTATTDGFVRGGPLDDLKARARRILNNEEADHGLLPFICKLDTEEEAADARLWVKANPSLPYNPGLMEEMKTEWAECQDNPMLYAAFMTKRMNIPIEMQETPVARWEDIQACCRKLPAFGDVPCVAGIDYASTNDFVAVGLLFKVDETYYWESHTFICTHSKDLKRIKAPLEQWEKDGLLTFIDAPEIPDEIVTGWLAEKAKQHRIMAVGVDQYRYAWLSSRIEALGFTAKGQNHTIKLVRPSTEQQVEPIINSCFIRNQIAWGENPLMCWYTNNTKKELSAYGNFKYDKIEPKSRKTDGFMAMVSAICAERTVLCGKLDSAPRDRLTPITPFVF